MVQTTFTRQKRELAKAMVWIDKIRAQEVRTVTFDPDDNRLNEVRDAYVDYPPEDVADKVLGIVCFVVGQHAARQQANSKNTGHLSWYGIEADLTVPQLRALQEAYVVLSDLVNRLPRRNPKLVANTTVDGRPAFAHPVQEHIERKSRWVPFEEDTTTRVRSYEQHYEVVKSKSQLIEIDYGLEVQKLEELQELVVDLGTSIQVAVDEANCKGYQSDPKMEELIANIRQVLLTRLGSSHAAEEARHT